MKTIVVGGGTGLIGRALIAQLARRGYRTIVVSRSSGEGRIAWSDDLGGALAGAAGVVNLAGASVGRRWTSRHKARIVQSRLETTGALVAAISALPAALRPPVLVSASGIDYAGDAGDAVVTESSPSGDSFLASVCVRWEAAASAAEACGVRVVRVRTPFVVGRGAPALRLMALPVRLCVGGPLGDGEQWFPWIHLADAATAYVAALEDESLSGPVNAVAPDLVRQVEVAHAMGAVLRRPAALRTPAFVLRLALGAQAGLLLHGQKAVSEKLSGLRFAFPELLPALEDALG